MHEHRSCYVTYYRIMSSENKLRLVYLNSPRKKPKVGGKPKNHNFMGGGGV
jgi:hypothetical protein